MNFLPLDIILNRGFEFQGPVGPYIVMVMSVAVAHSFDQLHFSLSSFGLGISSFVIKVVEDIFLPAP